MEKKIKRKTISLTQKKGVFSSIFDKIRNKNKSEIASLRQLLSNEKARILHTIKTENPESIYELAKILGRDFRAVRHDIRLLEKFGFVELISSHKKHRERLKPIIDVDQVVITIDL